MILYIREKQEKIISFLLLSQKLLQPLEYILMHLSKMSVPRNCKDVKKEFDDTFNDKNVANYFCKYPIFYFQVMTMAFARRI